MITSLAAKHFRSIRDEGMTFGPCTLLIGPNAGGKSTVFDAIRFLQGVGNGFTVREILDGAPETGARRHWDGIRGKAAEALWRGDPGAEDAASWAPGLPHDAFAIYVSTDGDTDKEGYIIAVDPAKGVMIDEQYRWHGKGFQVVDWDSRGLAKVRVSTGKRGRPAEFVMPAASSVLASLAAAPPDRSPGIAAISAASQALLDHLRNVQLLDLDVSCLRSYADPMHQTLGDHGENFAAVACRLAADGVLAPWLAELLPESVRSVKPFTTELGDLMFGLEETSGAHISARSLSDGTLRFAALATAMLAPTRPELLLVEEIENGLHPARLRVVVEMLLATTTPRTQVIATTHSPALVAWWPQERHRDILAVTRAEEDGGTVVTPLPDVPGYEEALKHHGLADLLIEGWAALPV